jgi:hypothetical protein
VIIKRTALTEFANVAAQRHYRAVDRTSGDELAWAS